MDKDVAQEWERLEEIARGNIERNLGCCVEDGDSADGVYDEAYTLGLDALIDAGVAPVLAAKVAKGVAMCYAQP